MILIPETIKLEFSLQIHFCSCSLTDLVLYPDPITINMEVWILYTVGRTPSMGDQSVVKS